MPQVYIPSKTVKNLMLAALFGFGAIGSDIVGQAPQADAEVPRMEDAATDSPVLQEPDGEANSDTAAPPEESSVDGAAVEAEDEATIAMRNWAADSETVLELLADARRHRIATNDTSVQSDTKKRAANAALAALNRRLRGRPISLRQVRVADVVEQNELSAVGRQRARAMVQQLRQQPTSAAWVGNGNLEENPILAFAVYMNLAMCNACFRPTGRYIAKLEIPDLQYGGLENAFGSAVLVGENADTGSIETARTEIEYVVNPDRANSFERRSIISIQARILSVFYNPSVDSIKLTLN